MEIKIFVLTNTWSVPIIMITLKTYLKHKKPFYVILLSYVTVKFILLKKIV